MTHFQTLIILAVVAVAIVLLVWWLLIESEGVYLGRRVVIWLYDLYAGRYDGIKQFSKQYDHQFLAQPIMERIAPLKSPLVLDVATGTGRLPLALCHHRRFQGRVIGIDLSRKMLARAAEKVESDARINLIWSPAEHLPFPDDTFDVVTCLEAVEFMSNREAVLREIIRVLRPDGQLLITNRINTRFMPGKTWTSDQLQALLETLSLERIGIDYWQVDYNRVWAQKPGKSLPTLARPLAEVLRCPKCDQALMIEDGERWTCPSCHFSASVAPDGVIELGIH